MTFLPWTDEYDVGVESLDADHRLLCRTISELHAAIDADRPRCDQDALADRIETVFRRHLADEERMLRASGYPGGAAHRREHQRLLGRLAGLRLGLLEEKRRMRLVVLEFVRAWFVSHLTREDRSYAEYLTGRAREAEAGQDEANLPAPQPSLD